MATLHTVNKSPFEKTSLVTCLEYAGNGAAVLLIEDGVYGAMKGTAAEGMVKDAMGDRKVYALKSDLMARAIKDDRLIDGIEVVDYAGFVDLVEANDKVQAWL